MTLRLCNKRSRETALSYQRFAQDQNAGESNTYFLGFTLIFHSSRDKEKTTTNTYNRSILFSPATLISSSKQRRGKEEKANRV